MRSYADEYVFVQYSPPNADERMVGQTLCSCVIGSSDGQYWRRYVNAGANDDIKCFILTELFCDSLAEAIKPV